MEELALIEQLLNEFYDHSSSNSRKREIENTLLVFQHNPNSWSICLENLSTTQNLQIWVFLASTVELTMCRKWNTLRIVDRSLLRQTLWNNYIHIDVSTDPKVKREKFAQLIAIMGKYEFPDEHPTYVDHIIELLHNNFSLGILLLRTTSEELVSTREDITADRKEYFQTCLSKCMPEIFKHLTKYLEICVYKCNNSTDLNIVALNEINNIESGLMDEKMSIAFIEFLKCVQHLFSWVPLDAVINQYFLVNLFELAKWREATFEISISAISAISELFYRQRALPLPQTNAEGIRLLLQQNRLEQANIMYQDKLTELLKLFTTQYWNKWINNETFFTDVISALRQYTLNGYGPIAFSKKLAIWTPIIKGLSPNGFGRYKDVMHLFVSDILKKIQFSSDNGTELELLDNDILDDDMQTEWQHYLSQCIETIGFIAEGGPIVVFEQVYSQWEKPFETFLTIDKVKVGNALLFDDTTKAHFFHCIIRDVSSLFQILTNLTPILQDCTESIPENHLKMACCLIHAIKYLTINKFHKLNYTNCKILSGNDFIEIFAQILSAIRSLVGWSQVFRNLIELKILIENVSQLLLPMTNEEPEPKIITIAAAQLLLSISSILRPSFIIQSVSFSKLVQYAVNLTYLDKEVVAYIQQTIVNCFVLPWYNVPTVQQEYDVRITLLQKYIARLANDLLEWEENVQMTNQKQRLIRITSYLLPLLKDVLDYFKDQNSPVKHLLAITFKPLIDKSIRLFVTYGSGCIQIANAVLNFTLSVLATLQLQLNASYMREMLEAILQVTTREKLTVNNFKTIDKLLQMFLLIIQNPSNLSIVLLPDMLNLTINFVQPLLLEDRNLVDYSDVAQSLFSLYDGILHHRWQYFYKSNILGMPSVTSTSSSSPSLNMLQSSQHMDQLLSILTAYGRAMVTGNDPHITRIILTSLQSLNERWKLFSRELFKINLLTSFQCALITALISPEGALHYDLLLNVLFAMGAVSENALIRSFVNLGYSAESKLIRDVCSSKDLPTFSYKMSTVIQDTRYSQFTQIR